MAQIYNINDRVIMKKPHACGTNEWIITRVEFEKKLRRIINEKD